MNTTSATESTPFSMALQPLRWADPWRWLARGWSDLRAAPGIALFYGLWFWAMAWVLGWVFRTRPEYVMSLASGCLLLGPFLAMGLYDTSRRREAGLAPELGQSITCWDRHLGSMGLLVLVLVLLELLWGRASLVVFRGCCSPGSPSATGARAALPSPRNWEFVAVSLLGGGVFAAPVFSTTVVSTPRTLDRDTDALAAGITSRRVVLDNTGVMLLWGALIALLVLASLWAWGAGLVLVGPLLGHASWHAYRSAVQGGPPATAAP